jgi:arylsulfatase A-like enzyme
MSPHRCPRFHFSTALALLTLLLLGCSESARVPPSVVFFVTDTLRADSLGCYGNRVVETPVVDQLAAEGVLFERAFAQSPWTRASLASILTGVYPEAHGVERRNDVLADRLQVLPEFFAEKGYATAAVITNPNVGSFFGFKQGYDEFYELYDRRNTGRVESSELVTPSNEVVDRALQWLEQVDGPYFLFALTIDPHWPYRPPERFDRYGGNYAGELGPDGGATEEVDLSLEDRRRVRSFYHGEVAFNDESFGRLLAALRERGSYDDTVVVFTSDHGEEFWEHGGRWHGRQLFSESTQVPLVIRYPRAFRAGMRVAEPVETIDIAPTLLELGGIPAPAYLDGRSLAGSSARAERVLYASAKLDGALVKSAMRMPWKLVWYPNQRRHLLFNLEQDPRERRSSYDSSRREADELLRLLRAAQAASLEKQTLLHSGAATPTISADEIPESSRKALSALGYLDGDDEE